MAAVEGTDKSIGHVADFVVDDETWQVRSSRGSRSARPMHLDDEMKNHGRTEYITRDTIMRLLSDEEIARVSTAETAKHLVDGEEYVDLEKPDQGVRRAKGSATAPMGQILARKAVRQQTWEQIVGLLSAHKAEAAARSRAN